MHVCIYTYVESVIRKPADAGFCFVFGINFIIWNIILIHLISAHLLCGFSLLSAPLYEAFLVK